MTTIDIRYYLLLMLICTLGVVGASFYFEYVDGLNPCPLCLMQRMCTIIILLTATAGLFLKPIAYCFRFCCWLQEAAAAFGIFFSSRQIWLQLMLPQQSTVCLPGFKMMVHYLPWKEVVRTLFLGAGDCSETAWHWLGLSMPAWALFYFLSIFALTGWCLYTQYRYDRL